MKLLKNFGWFLLALLSFVFIYGTVQSGAVSSWTRGFDIWSFTTLYRPVRSLCLWNLQMVSDRKG